MASALETELAELQEQLDRLNSARDPKDAAKEIFGFTEMHLKSDFLTRQNEALNPWIPEKEQKKGAKKKRW